MPALTYLLLGAAAIPFVYYAIAVFSAWRFFSRAESPARRGDAFTPAVSILKPIRGVDPDAYENFASFCRQDYPDYELVFCVSGHEDPVLPLLEKLQSNFPERRIRVLFGSGRDATNDKVAKLARLVAEAENEVVVINDSDVRVRPDYLRTLVAPLADPKVGAVTCFYVSVGDSSFAENLQTVGMISDFYASLLVAWQLDGVKFALGTTIVTTRKHLDGFGGYQTIENRPGDDLLVGRLIAEQGYTVELLNYAVETVADYQSISDLLHKRMRWIVVMRHMRPWGHFGLIFTLGLLWSLAAIAIHPSWPVALGFLGTYFALRLLMTWVIGIHGLKQPGLGRKMALIPVWDAMACLMWLSSFARKSVRWRGAHYYIRDGLLVPAGSGEN